MPKQFITSYRPKTFKEVIGQGEAAEIIQGLIQRQTILSRALLFYGPHGVGKTSLARILARHLNCEDYDTANFKVCGKCSFCVDAKDTDPAVEEMDFGSTRGIDTVRSLIDSLNFVSPYKARVVILDEVHHITPSAATALLKALEEPPDNVLFILVTTDPGKLLASLKSRCIRVPFGKVDDVTLQQHLRNVATTEGIKLPDYAYTFTVRHARGIVRDALGCLESIIARIKMNPDLDYSSHHVLADEMETNPESLIRFLIGGVYVGSYALAVPRLKTITEHKMFDAKTFISNLYEYHKQAFHLLINPDMKDAGLFSDYYSDFYQTIKECTAKKRMMLTIDSAEEIFEVILGLTEKAAAYTADIDKYIMLGVVRMVQAVKAHANKSYTNQSPFHLVYGPKEVKVD